MKVELKVDGQDISLNAFTQEIIGNSLSAMAESLHGVGPDWKDVEIRVKR